MRENNSLFSLFLLVLFAYFDNMAKSVTQFEDGSLLEYDRGAFDEWCVYLTRPKQSRYAPKDFQYFQRLREYASIYGAESLYSDFVSIYSLTTKTLNKEVFNHITSICSKYGERTLDIAIDFSIMYMGMIAEENKEFTKLGKRVKRLGVHQVLIDSMSPNEAANFSKGKKWRELDTLCSSKGF